MRKIINSENDLTSFSRVQSDVNGTSVQTNLFQLARV